MKMSSVTRLDAHKVNKERGNGEMEATDSDLVVMEPDIELEIR